MGLVQGPPADSVRAVLRDVFASNDYQWSLQRSLWTWITRAWRDLVTFMARLAAEHPVAYWVLMVVLMLILVLLFTHMAFVVRRALRRAPPTPHLPPHQAAPGHHAGWHRRLARSLAEGGRYPEALGHRFAALVLELESRRIVTVKPSKTPAEYAREVKFDGEGRAAFALLVQTLYAVLFGGRRAGAEDYVTFERDADALVHRAPAR